MNVKLIKRDEILSLHDMILEISPGRTGLLHANQLDGALERPFTYSQYKAVNLHTVCALLLDSLARNHAFNDGNKRTAIMTIIYTYAINDVFMNIGDETNLVFEDLVLWVVNSKPSIVDIESKLAIIVDNYKIKDRGFIRRLKKIFADRR